jgi:hypothetical protein
MGNVEMSLVVGRVAVAGLVSMAKLKQIVVDCRYPASLARFWAAALDEFKLLPFYRTGLAHAGWAKQSSQAAGSRAAAGPSATVCLPRTPAIFAARAKEVSALCLSSPAT